MRGGISDLRIYVAVKSPYPWDRGVTKGISDHDRYENKDKYENRNK